MIVSKCLAVRHGSRRLIIAMVLNFSKSELLTFFCMDCIIDRNLGIIDLQGLPPDQAFQAAVVIIGAGVAGLVLTNALRGSGFSVDVLEAGGASLQPQALFEAEMAGMPHVGTTEGRFRVCGGSSIRWGGQLLPLAANDF